MLKFLYKTAPGRMLLKVLTRPKLSCRVGKFMDSHLSACIIPAFVRKNNIPMQDYVETSYDCFNDFFCREIKPELRPIDSVATHLIAPCDGLLSAYEVSEPLVIPVKGSRYQIKDLLQDEKLARQYNGGICLVFRLCVHHYHRYCYPDAGAKANNIFIPGKLHTVRPVALREVPVFTENAREYTVLHTENFGNVIQMEVGAMLVGKIKNYHEACTITRGQEKGCFLYGGSTIILLLEPGQVQIAPEYLRATEEGKETEVIMGQQIGWASKSEKR